MVGGHAGGQLLHTGSGLHLGTAGFVGLVDAGGQHGLCALGADGPSCCADKGAERGAVDGQYQAGVGAELPGPHGQRIGKALCQSLGPRGQRLGQQEDGVDAAHLGIDGDGLGAVVGDAQERQAALARAGKADGLDLGVGHQGLAQFTACAQQQRENTFRHALALRGLLHRPRHHFGRTQMRAVRFHNHRCASGQCRCGIATRHRKRQREIAGTKHRHGAQRDLGQAQIGTGQRLALGLGRVDGGAQKMAIAHHLGKQTQLSYRAAALARQPGHGQAAFRMGALDQCIAQLQDLFGHRLQKGGALRQGQIAVGVERRSGQAGRQLNLVVATQAKLGLGDGSIQGGVEGALAASGAAHCAVANDHVSSDLHGGVPQEVALGER